MKPVSYTHLELARIAFVNADDVINAKDATLKEDASRDDLAAIPVSYTHLDVYKRQVLCLAWYETKVQQS